MRLKALKTLFCALLVAMLPAARPVLAAGTTPLSLVQQFDTTGSPLSGCLLYFFVAGTVATPQNAFADFGLTTALPNPVTCDQSGRVPQHWLADGLIHIRLTDVSGGVQVDTTMQVLGPSSGGGGGGGTVDPTTLFATGDLKVRYGTGAISGFVRANGLTIGNATSGATERANADTQNLFVYAYNADPNLAVSGGRTGNALSDFNASKQLSLPDWRGRAIAALDDMGNSLANRLTPSYFGNSGPCSGANATVLGVACGGENQTLTTNQIPPGLVGNNSNNFGVSVSSGGNHFPVANVSIVDAGYGSGPLHGPATNGNSGTWSDAGTSLNGTVGSGGVAVQITNAGGQPHPNVQPTMLATIYVRL